MLKQQLSITQKKMKNNKFESYLQDIFAEDYHGLDDEMSDAFDGWLANLDGEEYIAYAEDFGQRQYEAGLAEMNHD